MWYLIVSIPDLCTITYFYVDPCFIMNYLVSSLVICNHLGGEERAGCFAWIVFLMSCDCLRSVIFPHGAMERSAVSDCGISRSYSLTF